MPAPPRTPSPRRRARGVPAVLALVAAGLLAGCDEPPAQAPAVVRPVKIFTVGDAAHARVRDYPGTIRAAQTAEMAFEVPGRITEFIYMEGEEVEKGAVLAQIDPREYEAERDKQMAQLRKAQADLNRSESIFKQDPGAISKTKIDADKRAVGVAQAQVAQAEKVVEDTALVAPFSGLMARKLVEDFQNVAAKQPVLVLQDLTHLEIAVSIPEREVTRGGARLTPEQITERVKPRVIVSSIEGREFPARVKEMATAADPTTRTFQVKLIFEQPDDVTILPGMTARVVAEDATEAAIAIPSNAPRADAAGKPYVWLIDPKTMTVSPRPVDLGQMEGGSIEVLSGLEKGDEIAVSGVKQLTTGMQVKRYQSGRSAGTS